MNTILIILLLAGFLYFLYRNGTNRSLPNNHDSQFPQLNLNGYYFAYFNSKSVDGIPVSIPYIFIFNRHGLAVFAESDDAENIKNVSFTDWAQNLIQIQDIKQFDVSRQQANYVVEKDKLKILFFTVDEFTNSHLLESPKESPNDFALWEGRIIKDGLILSHTIGYYNASLQNYTTHSFFTNLKFDFVDIKGYNS